MKKFFFTAVLGAQILLAANAFAAAIPSEPQQAVESFIQTLREMNFPVQDQQAHAKLIEKARAFLDLEAIGKRALGNHFLEASPEQRETFLHLLRDLIEEIAYPRSNGFMGQQKITYPQVLESDGGYEVRSIIQQQEEGLSASVNYHVYLKDGQWKADDVVLDDVSITEDLQYQFDKIILQSQFEGLLLKMRERLEQARNENAQAA